MNPRIEVPVWSEEDLPAALTEFTRKVFTVLGQPGKTLHPRAFRRAVVGGKRVNLCPNSFPSPTWVDLVIEQLAFDLSGMNVRLLYNEKPWLEQPAIYCDAFSVVANAKKVASDWADENKKRQQSNDRDKGLHKMPRGKTAR